MTPPRQARHAGPPSGQSPQRQEMRRRILMLVGSIALVHGVVIAIYYTMRVQDRPMKTQQTFIAVWVVLTLAVLVPQMKGIRKMRRR